jgi:hypothetical protein
VSIWNYSDHLVSPPESYRISLGEGDTPLIRSRCIGPSLGLNHLFFKLENVNPTGSFKDRFAASAISHLLAEQSEAPLCLGTSSGNTGAALAAYSAAAGIPCILAIVDTFPGVGAIALPSGSLRRTHSLCEETAQIRAKTRKYVGISWEICIVADFGPSRRGAFSRFSTARKRLRTRCWRFISGHRYSALPRPQGA